jgi:hypothetical protein
MRLSPHRVRAKRASGRAHHSVRVLCVAGRAQIGADIADAREQCHHRGRGRVIRIRLDARGLVMGHHRRALHDRRRRPVVLKVDGRADHRARRVGAGEAEAADIEGVVVVAGNAICVADVFDQDAVVGSAGRPRHLIAAAQPGDRQGAVGVDRSDRSKLCIA